MRKSKKIYDASLPPVKASYFITVKSLLWSAKLFLRAKIEKNPELSNLQGPIIAIGNHPSFLDPVFMAAVFWPRNVHVLTTRSFYRSKLLRCYMQSLRTIPKTQFRSDAQAIKHMLRVIRNKGIIGIYPEGQRSLDGSDLPIDDAIGKFIKKVRCTVVMVSTRGAYLSWPRWTEGFLRPGKIRVRSDVLLKPHAIEQMDAAAIQRKIKQALAYNEYEWQSENRQRFFSVAPALGLQNLCHKCPDCREDLVMKAKRRSLHCNRCGYVVKLNLYGFFEPERTIPLKLATPYQWHQWQIDQLKTLFSDDRYLLKKSTALYRVDVDKGKSFRISHGTISMQRTGLSFTSDATQRPFHMQFPVFNRAGISADFGDYFECVLADEVYRFVPDEGQAVILFADAIYAIQAINQAEGSLEN